MCCCCAMLKGVCKSMHRSHAWRDGGAVALERPDDRAAIFRMRLLDRAAGRMATALTAPGQGVTLQ